MGKICPYIKFDQNWQIHLGCGVQHIRQIRPYFMERANKTCCLYPFRGYIFQNLITVISVSLIKVRILVFIS